MAIDVKLQQRLEALPIHSPQQYERQSLDPRLAQEFIQSRSLSSAEAEQLTQYVATSKWSSTERAVYGAVVQGFTTVEELETVTGLTIPKITSVVGKLERKGVLRKVSEASRL